MEAVPFAVQSDDCAVQGTLRFAWKQILSMRDSHFAVTASNHALGCRGNHRLHPAAAFTRCILGRLGAANRGLRAKNASSWGNVSYT